MRPNRSFWVALGFATAWAAAWAAAGPALPARAQPGGLPPGLSRGDGRAIRGVIARQIAAFGRDDAEEAFSYASPGIREMFGTPARFMEMVREGYRPVYRPRAFTFGAILLFRGEPVQRVLVVDPDGVPVTALYFMQRQPGGGWRIDGCQLLRPAGEPI